MTNDTHAVEAEVRARLALLVEVAGSQQDLARQLGTHQALISRFLSGHPLSPNLAAALHRRYPGLRRQLGAILFNHPFRRVRQAMKATPTLCQNTEQEPT